MEEHYWSLIIEEGWVQAAIWKVDQETKKAILVAKSNSTAWADREELVNASDTALSVVLQNMPAEFQEPAKTVFGVPPSWVSEGQITKEHIVDFKEICSKLDLVPTGFVVLPEAIAHYYKIKDGTPLNAVIVGVGKELVDLTIFKLGNLIGTTTVARSISFFEDIVEALARFSGIESLPSRFIIYDGKEGELEDARQQLLSSDWKELEKEKIKFLHEPKVEIIDMDEKILAVSLAGASEISGASQIFIANVPPLPQTEVKDDTGSVALGPEEVGFVVGEDVSLKVSPFLGSIKHIFGLVFSKIKFMNMGNFRIKVKLPTSGNFTLAVLILIIVFLLGGMAYWWFIPKAEVIIYVTPQKLEEKDLVVVSPSVEKSDLDSKILAGKIIETSVSGEKTRSTTGTKRIGEKAKGVVKVRNGTSSIINFPSGTIINGPNELKFTLDNSASVSAALSPSNPGTQVVNVSSNDIGAEYNLAKEEIFKVGNYPKSEVDATSESDFSGGSSKEITAVSLEDRDLLEEELKDELTQEGRKKLEENLSEGEIFIPESIASEIDDKNFSGKVGDEASTLKLSISLRLKAISISREDFVGLAKGILNEKVPKGYSLRNDQIDAKFNLSEKEEEKRTFEVTFEANLLPEINFDETLKAIAGKYPHLADEYLNTIPGFSRAEIRIKPRLPSRLETLPHVVKNISIEVTSE